MADQASLKLQLEDDRFDNEKIEDLPLVNPRPPKRSCWKRGVCWAFWSIAWLCGLAVVGVLLVLHTSPDDPLAFIKSVVYESSLLAPAPSSQCKEATPSPTFDGGDHSLYLHGPPAKSFRDNLRNESRYITGWGAAGWTNDVMTTINLIYLGLLTDRIPILPPFKPLSDHMDESAGPINFGEVFDVQKLQQSLKRPILEWWEVKNYTDEEADWDDIGCWSPWALLSDDKAPRGDIQPDRFKLDISYTSTPEDAHLVPQLPNHLPHVTFWGLAELAFPESRGWALERNLTTYPSGMRNHSLPPDEHLLCYDFLYFVSAHKSFEFEADYSPAWRFVGTYLHWTSQVQSLGDQYLRKAFGVQSTETVPPYITVHVRHTDFDRQCIFAKPPIPMEKCFAPLSTYAEYVEDARKQLIASPDFSLTPAQAKALPVIVTSDEKSHQFWNEVAELGWLQINHTAEGTAERYGLWYEVILDAYFQSSGVGVVGTRGSTMSLLAQRRVEDWTKGAALGVYWSGHSKENESH